MSEPIDLTAYGELGDPCNVCKATTQIVTTAKGSQYRIFTTYDPDTDRWWCTACYVEDGKIQRQQQMIDKYSRLSSEN